ncbi:Phytanoyl-CoA dioxygenase (PhyH) [uncultured virus]|nr:Phytanoyl-CoA dioxygenase (PhyH) [uncultured virus]
MDRFQEVGCLTFNNIIDSNLGAELAIRLERLFNGEFETGLFPDVWTWRPKLSRPDTTREIVNAWKCDKTIASVVCSSAIGKYVADLMDWPGTKIAQDDLWWKPPGHSEGILWHQDATYMTSVDPCEVCTVWIALDNTDTNVGTLEYVPGSHKWSLIKGIPRDFFSPQNPYDKLEQAAKENNIKDYFSVPLIVPRGGGGIHHGLLFHGSGQNHSEYRPRRSLAIHFVSSEAKFSNKVNYIYGRYKHHNSNVMDEDFFPITYTRTGYRTPFLTEYCKDITVNFELQ